MCWLSHLPDLEGMQSTDEICCFGLHKGFGYVRAVLGLLQFLLNFDFFLLCLLWAPIQQKVSVKHLSHLCMVNLEAERTYICMCSLMYSLLLLWCWGQLCCWQQQGLAVSSSLTWLCDRGMLLLPLRFCIGNSPLWELCLSAAGMLFSGYSFPSLLSTVWTCACCLPVWLASSCQMAAFWGDSHSSGFPLSHLWATPEAESWDGLSGTRARK